MAVPELRKTGQLQAIGRDLLLAAGFEQQTSRLLWLRILRSSLCLIWLAFVFQHSTWGDKEQEREKPSYNQKQSFPTC